MRKTWLVIIMMVAAANAHASFEQQLGNARSMGMGGAFAGLADGAEAVYYNAAGLAQLQKPEFSGSYGRLYPGLTDRSNLGNSNITASYPVLTKDRRINGVLGAGLNIYSLAGNYSETSFGVYYGRAIDARWAVGGGLKYLSVSYGKDEYTPFNTTFSNGLTKSNVSLDLGAMYYPAEKWSFGLALRDANSPDLGLKYGNVVAQSIVMGSAFREREYTLTGDVAVQGEQYRIVIGGERWYSGRRFALRGGFGLGSESYLRVSAGAGYAWENIVIDYSFFYPLSGMADTYGTHKFTFGYRINDFFVRSSTVRADMRKEKEETKKTAMPEKKKSNAPVSVPVQGRSAASTVATRQSKPAKETAVQNAAPAPVAVLPTVPEIVVPSAQDAAGENSRRTAAKKAMAAAESLIQKGEYSPAAEKVREALKLSPDNPSYKNVSRRLAFVNGFTSAIVGSGKFEQTLRRGLAAYCKEGAVQNTITLLMYAASFNPDDAATEQLVRETAKSGDIVIVGLPAVWNPLQTKLTNAQGLLNAKNFQECVARCEEVIFLDPENYRAYEMLGSAYYGLGNFDRAEKCWEKALKYKPKE